MKKIVGIMAVAAMATSMFAADVAAKVKMTGSIASSTHDEETGKLTGASFGTLDKADQKDADAVVISVNGDKAGANFQFWYNYDGSGSSSLNVRSTSLWLKPADMVKITVGDISVGTYTEQINYWKVPTGVQVSDYEAWNNRYSSYATVEGAGINIEVTPIEGLWLSAGTSAGAGKSVAEVAKDGVNYAAVGAAAKYSLSGFGIPVSAAVSYRDTGKDLAKIVAVGADYGNAYGAGFYGFLNARFYFDKTVYKYVNEDKHEPYTTTTTVAGEFDSVALSGICFDNYEKFSVGAFKIQARVPVTLRGIRKSAEYDAALKAKGATLNDVDPSYFSFAVKASYGLGNYTPYLYVGNENAITFNKDFVEKLKQCEIKPGVTFNVGSCSVDVGVDLVLPATGKDIKMSVPVELGVAF